MLTYNIQTFGCHMNHSDSERMETYIEALGFSKTEDPASADMIIYNTCSIKQKAEDKVYGSMRKIREIKKTNPNLVMVVTGCMIRTSSSRYSSKRDKLFPRMKELDIALRIEELPVLASLIREVHPHIKIPEIEEESLEDYFKIDATHDSHQSKSQAFVAISNGCDKFCTYCIVPYSRGREKSRKTEDVLAEVEELVKNGCKEVTLVGQTVNSFGLSRYDQENETFAHLEANEPFVDLLEKLDQFSVRGLQRVRFTSPHPKDMSDALIEAMASLKTQMPYLHLPVQSGDDRTLKRMNRPYTIERFREAVKSLRERIPDISISTDIIVGFCGETEEEFENTYNFFQEMGFEHAYISQYSERTGTTAAKFIKDDIAQDVKKKRWHRLNDLLRETSQRGLKRFHGKVVNVIVESQEGKVCLGRNEHYKTVQFNSDKSVIGEMLPIKITNSKDWILEGELI
jgi:tRNA-2-methylthio-N6-dimethylallyladenosine synthase